MTHLEAHPSQDILAGLPSPESAEVTVHVRDFASVETAVSPAQDPLAAVAFVEAAVDATLSPAADPLAQAQEQLSDPLTAMAWENPAVAVQVPAAAGLRKALADRLAPLFNYVCVSAIIFVVLLGTLNWHAYTALAKSWLNPQELERANASISTALAAAAVSDDAAAQSGAAQAQATVAAAPAAPQDEAKDAKRAAILEERLKQDKVTLKRDWLSAGTFVKNAGELAYNVEITPYDNRIIIPKLGKNIPLVNVDNHKVGNPKDWNKIFEKELEKGIIKYPGSADPGEAGNAFVFGHSSNFPWIKGDYNDVFALLDKLEYGDEVTVFFKQKKYVYVIREKHVIKPGYVNSMKGKEDSKQLSLMTCWPVGTTLNRLIVMGDLKDASPAAGGVARQDGTLISMK